MTLQRFRAIAVAACLTCGWGQAVQPAQKLRTRAAGHWDVNSMLKELSRLHTPQVEEIDAAKKFDPVRVMALLEYDAHAPPSTLDALYTQSMRRWVHHNDGRTEVWLWLLTRVAFCVEDIKGKRFYHTLDIQVDRQIHDWLWPVAWEQGKLSLTRWSPTRRDTISDGPPPSALDDYRYVKAHAKRRYAPTNSPQRHLYEGTCDSIARNGDLIVKLEGVARTCFFRVRDERKFGITEAELPDVLTRAWAIPNGRRVQFGVNYKPAGHVVNPVAAADVQILTLLLKHDKRGHFYYTNYGWESLKTILIDRSRWNRAHGRGPHLTVNEMRVGQRERGGLNLSVHRASSRHRVIPRAEPYASFAEQLLY